MSRANYRLRNRNAIKRGFERLKKTADFTCRNVVVNMGRDGLIQLVDAHRLLIDGHDGHHLHLIEENTLGYAVAHDGMIIESGYHNGSGIEPLPGEAMEMARTFLQGLHGWRAVILSDMKWGHYDGHEEDMLNYAREVLRDKWDGGVFGSGKVETVYIIPNSIDKPS